LGAAATCGRDRKVAYVVNIVSGVTIDCMDAQRVARFWSALLGREPGPSQDGWVYLGHRGDPQPRLVFQPVHEPKAGKVRVHLDVTVDDVDEAIKLVTALGGRSTGERHDYDEGAVVVMADPEDHEFCLVQYY
jgi:predicted enzyme related to lactoylglutathione lyase